MRTNDTHESATETDTAHLMAGAHITFDELATELSAIELRLRQLARAAEVPATPVELADVIDSLRSTASSVRENGERMGLLARIVDGEVPLVTTFPTGDPWGVAARASDRQDFGGPAIVLRNRRRAPVRPVSPNRSNRGPSTCKALREP
ncbi:hypothetical protein ACFXP3_10435 [Streptomyces sp. NPDC059096]|uniref:hypothetical protein n=1 Tax=Streptomyces sp. NPDC059096 TaxID=3346727 RepID=UPI0036BE86B8